nr:MAG TPA: hypothetical protein [Caudoviricetes sp.]
MRNAYAADVETVLCLACVKTILQEKNNKE